MNFAHKSSRMKNFGRLTQAVLRLLDKEKDDLDVGGMLSGPWPEIKDFGPMPKRMASTDTYILCCQVPVLVNATITRNNYLTLVIFDDHKHATGAWGCIKHKHTCSIMQCPALRQQVIKVSCSISTEDYIVYICIILVRISPWNENLEVEKTNSCRGQGSLTCDVNRFGPDSSRFHVGEQVDCHRYFAVYFEI